MGLEILVDLNDFVFLRLSKFEFRNILKEPNMKHHCFRNILDTVSGLVGLYTTEKGD